MKRTILFMLLLAALLPATAGAHPANAARPLCYGLQECRDELAKAKDAIRWHKSLEIKAFQPSVEYALKLCKAIYGPRCAESTIRSIGGCESGNGRPGSLMDPLADNPSSSAGGAMQYLLSTWARVRHSAKVGFCRFDPVAAILAAARHFASGGSDDAVGPLLRGGIVLRDLTWSAATISTHRKPREAKLRGEKERIFGIRDLGPGHRAALVTCSPKAIEGDRKSAVNAHLD